MRERGRGGSEGNKNQRQRSKGEVAIRPCKNSKEIFFSIFFFSLFFSGNSWAQKLVISFWKIRGCVAPPGKNVWGTPNGGGGGGGGRGESLGANSFFFSLGGTWGRGVGKHRTIHGRSQKFQKYKISPAKKLGPTHGLAFRCVSKVPASRPKRRSKNQRERKKERTRTHIHTDVSEVGKILKVCAREAIGGLCLMENTRSAFFNNKGEKTPVWERIWTCAFKKLAFAQQKKVEFRFSFFFFFFLLENGKRGPRGTSWYLHSVAATRVGWQFVSRKR